MHSAKTARFRPLPVDMLWHIICRNTFNTNERESDKMRFLLPLFLLITFTVTARPSYTAYSGGAGSKGTCASSCHGSGTGTITVSGFPATYVPGTVYVITVGHSSGSAISNFNASTRKGTTTAAAGTIAAGSGTALYSVSGYESGVRSSSNNVNTAAFSWTAPAAGTGSVTLYLSGSQGSKSGPNTKIVLTSAEGSASAVRTGPSGPQSISLAQNYPNPFNPATTVRYSIGSASYVTIGVTDLLGRNVAMLAEGRMEPGEYSVRFDGTSLPAGVYRYRLTAGEFTMTRKMVLVK